MFDEPEIQEDRPEETPAGGENPWYVLMTIAGTEAEPGDLNFHERNRRYWNGWQAQALSDEQKTRLIGEGRARQRDLAPLQEEEQAKIARELAVRAGVETRVRPGDEIDLRGVEVEAVIHCLGYVFPAGFDCANARLGELWLDDATFLGPVTMNGARLDFITGKRARFDRFVQLNSCTIADANFHGARMLGRFELAGGRLTGAADFESCDFGHYADFHGTRFQSVASFQNVRFAAATRFDGADFTSDAGAPPSFPPKFHNAVLHEDTDFSDARWPAPPTEREQALQHRRAYEKLKLLMGAQSRAQDEHMFHRMEMRCREVEAPGALVTFASRLFRVTSDYGWSLSRPVVALVLVWCIGAALLWVGERGGAGFAEGRLGVEQAIGLSLSNTFGFLGLGPYFMGEAFRTLTAGSEVVSGLQMVLGPVFLFLLALALRNRFRMR